MVKITRKGARVQEQLLEYIEKKGYYPHSTSDLALKLGYSWHTVQQYCFELLLKGKIDRLVIGGSHIWIKKGSYISEYSEGSSKIDEAIEQLLDKEINQTFKELQRSLQKEPRQKKQEEKLGEKFHERKQ